MTHHIEKPTLFISHASTDASFAMAVQQEIDKVFANGVEVFCTSSPGAVRVGQDWLTDIEAKLASAKALIAIVTPTSIERPWLWFELGASWSSGRSGACRIYPLCAAEVSLSDLPPPLNRLQALSLARAPDIKLLFEALIAQFGFGDVKRFRASNITTRVPKYSRVKILDADLNDRPLYSGPYAGYADDELMEVIDTKLFHPSESPSTFRTHINEDREQYIGNGRLLHFRAIDSSLELPPGSARRLLNTVAKRYRLVPILETDNLVRYRNAKR